MAETEGNLEVNPGGATWDQSHGSALDSVRDPIAPTQLPQRKPFRSARKNAPTKAVKATYGPDETVTQRGF